jgi:hypothetical protein
MQQFRDPFTPDRRDNAELGEVRSHRGSLNSAHIHGTHVPVEEPSTASIGAYSITSSARASRSGDGEAESLSGSQIDGQLEFGWLLHR